MREISDDLYQQLDILGLIPNKVRSYNVGDSNYADKLIQPWVIWKDYPELTAWDYDIIKRVLRIKLCDGRKKDYEKIIHICEERIRQLDAESAYYKKNAPFFVKCIKDYYEDDGDKLRTLFLKGFLYHSPSNGHLRAHDGSLFAYTDEFLNEFFIQ